VLASSVVISLMDNATSLSVWTKLREFRPQVTMDLRVDYLRPSPKGAKIYGRGTCYHMTRSVAFVRGIAHNGNPDDPLAMASGTFIRIGSRIG
jgi:acyl-coenzyme A thioesterase PaaI-like protein